MHNRLRHSCQICCYSFQLLRRVLKSLHVKHFNAGLFRLSCGTNRVKGADSCPSTGENLVFSGASSAAAPWVRQATAASASAVEIRRYRAIYRRITVAIADGLCEFKCNFVCFFCGISNNKLRRYLPFVGLAPVNVFLAVDEEIRIIRPCSGHPAGMQLRYVLRLIRAGGILLRVVVSADQHGIRHFLGRSL